MKTLHPRIHAAILARRDRDDDLATLDEHDDRAVRPRLRQPLPVRAGRRALRRARGGRRRDDRRRRPVDAARGREELRARRAGLPARSSTSPCSPSCASTASSRSTRAPARGRGVRDDGRLRGGDRALVRATRAVPASSSTLAFEKVPDALVRREPAPAGRATTRRRGARRHLLSQVEQLQRQAALLQQPQRPLGRAPARCASSTLPALRDRQAREPVRRRARGDDRGGVRARARVRSRCRRTAASSCSTVRSAPSSARALAEQFVEVLLAPGYDDAGARRACTRSRARGSCSTASAAAYDRGERDYKRVLGGLLVQDRDRDVEDREGMDVVCGDPTEEDWGDLLFAWRVVQARRLERDRAREGPADDRDRRRPDEPRRRRPDRGREGARARPRPDRRGARVGRVLPVRRRPAARARRRRHGDHPAGRLEARRRGDRGGRERRRDDGASPAAAISGTESGDCQAARLRRRGRASTRPCSTSSATRRSSGSTGSRRDVRRDDPREARVPESGRLGQGSDRAGDDRGGRARGEAEARAGRSSSRPRATRASGSRSPPRSRATAASS